MNESIILLVMEKVLRYEQFGRGKYDIYSR